MTSGSLLFIVAGATCFGRYLTVDTIPGQVTEAVLLMSNPPTCSSSFHRSFSWSSG